VSRSLSPSEFKGMLMWYTGITVKQSDDIFSLLIKMKLIEMNHKNRVVSFERKKNSETGQAG